MGVEDPYTIAKKHGYTEKEYLQLNGMPWFHTALDKCRATLDEAGFNFTTKMKMLAEDLIVHTYHQAKLSDSVNVKLDVAKHLTKVAGLEPAQNNLNPLGAGGAFQVVINFGANSGRPPLTIESSANSSADPATYSDATLTPPPTFITQLLRRDNSDLTTLVEAP